MTELVFVSNCSFDMDSQKFREHAIFTDMVEKKKKMN
jgi:hypothetical protein